MKQIAKTGLFIFFVAGLLLTTGAGCATKEEKQAPLDTSTWSTYNNSGYKVSFKYPVAWEKQDKNTENKGLATLTALLSPLDTAKPDEFSSLTLSIDKNSYVAGMTLDQYVDQNLTSLQANPAYVTLDDYTNATLGGEPAKKIVYRWRNGDQEFKIMQVIALRNSMAYVANYTGLPNLYTQYLPDVQNIISTFKFE